MSFSDVHDYYTFANLVKKCRAPLYPKARNFLGSVRETMSERELTVSRGAAFYRAQIGFDVEDDEEHGPSLSGYSEDRMVPKLEYVRAGRANADNQVVLYLATSVETAISELRPWLEQEISVAVFATRRELKIANLTPGYGTNSYMVETILSTPVKDIGKPSAPPDQATIDRHVWNDIDKAFSKPVTRGDERIEYAPTQILSELFRTMGYDGIAYKSNFGGDKGYNIALYNVGDAEISSCAPYDVTSITVDFRQLGNGWFKKKES